MPIIEDFEQKHLGQRVLRLPNKQERAQFINTIRKRQTPAKVFFGFV